MTTPFGVQRLLLSLRTQHVKWALHNGARHGLISTNGLATWFHGSILDTTLQRALADRLVTLGSPEPLPEYELGRGQWRHVDGTAGRPIAITEAGAIACFER